MYKTTKRQFEEYVSIRDSGITNMYDVKFITDISCTGLNRELCLEIMSNFADMASYYNVSI